jgi:hypothetical protein
MVAEKVAEPHEGSDFLIGGEAFLIDLSLVLSPPELG